MARNETSPPVGESHTCDRSSGATDKKSALRSLVTRALGRICCGARSSCSPMAEEDARLRTCEPSKARAWLAACLCPTVFSLFGVHHPQARRCAGDPTQRRTQHSPVFDVRERPRNRRKHPHNETTCCPRKRQRINDTAFDCIRFFSSVVSTPSAHGGGNSGSNGGSSARRWRSLGRGASLM